MVVAYPPAMRHFAIIVTLFVAACGGIHEELGTHHDPLDATTLPGEGTPESVGALLVAQDCTTTYQVLDDSARLYSNAAAAIVRARNGADGLCGTADDYRFQWQVHLLTLPAVGPSNFGRLVKYAISAGRVPAYNGGTVEGVTFTDEEAYKTLVAVNSLPYTTLDRDAGIRSDAAHSINATRPFASLQGLAAARYVGTATLAKLKEFANPAPATDPPAPEPAGYVLTESALASITQRLKEGLSEDEAFGRAVADLARWDEAVVNRIMRALEAELDQRARAYLGRTYASEAEAKEAVAIEQATIKQRTTREGWSYLLTIGAYGFLMTETELALIVQTVKEGFYEDENFSGYVVGLAGGGEDENIPVFVRIMEALELELDRQVAAASLVGTTYATRDDGVDAVGNIGSAIKRRVEAEGWAYLESLGVTR